MSADTDVIGLLYAAIDSAEWLTKSANALVTSALEAIQQDVKLPGPQWNPEPVGIMWNPEPVGISMPDAGFSNPAVGISMPDAGFSKPAVGLSMPGGRKTLPEAKPSFPRWPILNLGKAPSLQDLDKITATFTKEFHDLDLPSFNYPKIAALGAFSYAFPEVSTAITMPPLPAIEVGFSPDRMDSLPITTPDLSLPDVALAPINTEINFDPNTFSNAYGKFRTAIFSGIGAIPGLDTLLSELRALTNSAFDILLPELMTIIRKRLTDRYSPVLAYHTDLQQRLEERLNTARDQVLALSADQDRSGWSLPAAVRIALRATAEQVAQAWKSQALSQHDTQTMELALAFFEAVGDLFENLYEGYLALRKGEIEQILEAHRLSLAYAKQVIAALLAQYEAENFTKNEIEQKKAEAKLAAFEAELKLGLARYEIAKGRLEAEQGRLDNDSNLIKQYQADLTKAGLDVKLYAAQVSAARSEAEVQGLPQEIFALKVRLFDAEINAYEARIRAYLAEISEDSAKAEGELAKVQAFEAEARAFTSLIAAKSSLSNAQADRNKQVVAEFTSLVKADLLRIEQGVLKDKHAMAEYEVKLEDILADAKLKMRRFTVDMDYDHKKTDADQKAIDATNAMNMDLVNTEMARLKAIAEVNARGASILADMAGGAMSAANVVAGVIIEESD